MSGPRVLAIDAVGGPAVAKVWEIFLSNEQIEKLYLCGDASREVKAAFFEAFPHVQAAGGLVAAPSGRLLLIHRRGEWDLPKGKQEPGETDEETALREVAEETGVGALTIAAPLCQTHHVFIKEEQPLIKRTAWYAMTTDAEHSLAPQTEEEIDAAEWVSADQAWARVQTSFPSIQRVFEAFRATK